MDGVFHDTVGHHVLLDVWGVPFETLNDLDGMRDLLREAARISGATVVEETFHRFPVQGLSGVLVLAESHISVHTTPEHGYASFDVFTCGENMRPMEAARFLVDALPSSRYYVREFVRGTEAGIVEAEEPLPVTAAR
ncbi:MAG: adenosylmethionine decarboxylase [Bacillota bacterium]|nr:adenosylmethionine decarboxylase [Bacillota bacterium]